MCQLLALSFLRAFLWQALTVLTIDIESLQNRLLKVCYMPATSTGLSRLLFLSAINSTNEANKAGSMRL